MLRRRSPFVLSVAFIVAGCGGSASQVPGSPLPSLGAPASAAETTTTPLPSYAPALATLPPPPIDVSKVPARVHLDSGTSSAVWVGPGGGTVSATASDGTSYTLDVPPAAVSEATPITMTPIDAVDGVGLSGGLAGSVYLQPVGQTFAVPATLRIATTKTPPAGTQLVGFDVADDGDTIDLIPALAGEGGLAVPVFHFSSPGIGFGTTDDLKVLTAANPARPEESIRRDITELLSQPVPWTTFPQAEAYRLILLTWHSTVEPELRAARTDADVLATIADWRQLVFAMNLLAHRGDVTLAFADGAIPVGPWPELLNPLGVARDGMTQVGTRIHDAIVGNTSLCQSSHDLTALANIAFWAATGATYSPGSGPWTGLTDACATIEFNPFNPASNLRGGGSDSTRLALAWTFHDGTVVPADFDLSLIGHGFTFASNGSDQLTVGEPASTLLTLSLNGVADGPYGLDASACWSLNGVPRNVCRTDLHQTFGAAPTGAPATAAPAGSGGPDWSAPCMVYAYQGTYTDFTVPSHTQHPGSMQILSPCRGAPATMSALSMDGFDITQERIVFKVEGSPIGFTATELGCPGSGLPNNGCTGNTTIHGGGGAALTFTVSATKSGEEAYAFVGQLAGTFSAN